MYALEKWGETSKEGAALSDEEYEPMSAEEIEEALRDCDYDPCADFVEDESSVAPAVPGAEQDQYKAPKFAPVAKPGVFVGYRFEPGKVEGRLLCCRPRAFSSWSCSAQHPPSEANLSQC